MKVTFCSDISPYHDNKIFDKSVAGKYPGALWLSFYEQLAKKKGVEVVTGDVALSNLQAGYWKPTDILVIQELDAQHGKKLIGLGAFPFLLLGLESPLYAYDFYDHVQEIAPLFKHRVLFSGIFKTFHGSSGFNHLCRFPSYNVQDLQKVENWAKRKFLVMVANNKYFEKPYPWPYPKYPTEHFDWIKDKWNKCSSYTRKIAIKNELINKRLEAIEYFGQKKRLNLYGRGWDDLTRLPQKWQRRLRKILANLKPKGCVDKVKTISRFKFSICFENVSYRGYVTEKIIDCFVAGVIPIYLGAPDIADFVPADSFIDMRAFDSFKHLNNFLTKMTQQDALKMISAGRRFLQSPEGKLHSHLEMAKFILGLILQSLSGQKVGH